MRLREKLYSRSPTIAQDYQDAARGVNMLFPLTQFFVVLMFLGSSGSTCLAGCSVTGLDGSCPKMLREFCQKLR